MHKLWERKGFLTFVIGDLQVLMDVFAKLRQCGDTLNINGAYQGILKH